MALKALSIIHQEFARARANTPYVRHALLVAIEQTITERIEKECIEQGSPKCTWCKTGDAVDTFWVQELGEFRDSKEDLCEQCAGSLPGEGIRVEAVVKEIQAHCRFCGEVREGCHGGGGPDGMEAHDFTPPTPEEIHPLDDVPF